MGSPFFNAIPGMQIINRWQHEGGSLTALIWPWCLAAGLLVVPFLPALYIAPLAVALAVCLGLCYRFNGLNALAILLAGALWASCFAAWVLSSALEPALEGQEVTVVGSVLGVPKIAARYVQFNFKVAKLSLNGALKTHPQKIRLRWYGQNLPTLIAGDKWQFLVKLKRPHGLANPAAFDYEAWLLSQRLRATGYIRQAETAKRLQQGAADAIGVVDGFRARFAQFLAQAQLKQSAIITALSIGVRQTMSAKQWAVLRNTGTNHLVAISGLHIGLIAGLLYFLGGFIWRHTLLTRTFYPSQKAAWFFALAGGIAYAALAGFAIPTKRALLMLIAVAVLYFMGRRPGAWFSLGLVLALVLLFDPLAPLNVGFWLSFMAVGFILLSAYRKTAVIENPLSISPLRHFCMQTLRRTRTFAQIQWALLIGLAPILLLMFHKISLVALVANFFAVPFIGFMMLPIILLGAFLFSIGMPASSLWLLRLADSGIDWGWHYLQWLSAIPYATWQHSISAPLALLALIGSAGLLLQRFGHWRWLFATAWLPALLLPPSAPKPGELWLSVLDVGQGLATVVQTHKHTLLYDTGPRYSDRFDIGAAIVAPYLRYNGISALDTVVISHDNNDHSGGFGAINAQFKVGRLITGPNEGIANSEPCLSGQRWQWDGVEFEFIYPFADTVMQGNNGSCVLKITHAQGSILLTGDIEKKAEQLLLNTTPSRRAALQADILIAPHHGSKSSSTAGFIAMVAPKQVVFSAGYKNHFQHPHPKITAAYKAFGAQTFATANTGRILFKLADSGISTALYREQKRHFWHLD